MKILNVSQMQQAERDSSRYGISLDQLMENAGLAVADSLRKLLGDLSHQIILVLVGPGNNGGDGLVAARHLHDWGASVRVYLCAKRKENDPNLIHIKQRNLVCEEFSADSHLSLLRQHLAQSTVVLDAIFGTGQSRPITGSIAQVLNQVAAAHSAASHFLLFSLDLPSGLNADTGQADPQTPMSDYTITLGFPKIGLFSHAGAEHAGNLTVVNIGIPSEVVSYVNLDLTEKNWVKAALPKRSLVSHKGTYGKLLALVGSVNYSGAAYLSTSGSIRVGAGLTALAITESLLPVLAAKTTEVIYLPLPESSPYTFSPQAIEVLLEHLPQYDTFLIGCGIGKSPATVELVKRLLLQSKIKLPPLIVDADCLGIFSGEPDWYSLLSQDAILTPHSGEMARLAGKSVEEIQENRIGITREYALKWNKTIVLKGAYTVIASPDGRIRVSPFANAGLASAGTGDVLAGAIAGMVAQGLSLFDAASCGVYVHGLAGEIVKAELGDAGMLAGDLLPVLPKAIRQLKQG